MVDLPLEPIYEEAIMYSSAQSERARARSSSQRASIDELAKQMSATNRNWHNVWRQTMATGGSKDSVSFLLEHRGGRTSDPKL